MIVVWLILSDGLLLTGLVAHLEHLVRDVLALVVKQLVRIPLPSRRLQYQAKGRKKLTVSNQIQYKVIIKS
jgi:hypothetical protein